MTARWIEAGGVALRYELSGQRGPVVVLLHEMGGTMESWDYVLPRLQQEYRTLRFDMRGFGLSEKIRSALTPDQLVDDVIALLDALSLDTPVALAGCAVGAAVALRFAARHPSRAAMVVASSPATGIAPEKQVATLDTIDLLGREGPRGLEVAALAGSYPVTLRNADPERFEAVRLRWLGNDPESFAAVYRMLVHSETASILSSITAPVLLIGCTQDLMRPAKDVAALAAQIRGGVFALVDSGHILPVQNPDALLELMLPFLKEHADCFVQSPP